MSRGDFGTGFSTYNENKSAYGRSAGPGGGYPRNGDSEYIRLSNSISNNIGSFTRKIASIQRMVNQIGTPQDVPELFDRLQQEQKESHHIAQETTDLIKNLSQLETSNPNEARQRKIQMEKFQENFTNALHNFQKVQRLAAEKERASVQRARTKSLENNTPGFPPMQESDNMFPSSQFQIQGEADLDLDMIREREEALKQLESNIVDVNDMFKELAIMVHEQGQTIDSIEANVETAAVHVEQGNTQLEKAKAFQKAARKKMCCILLVLLVAAAVVGLIIYFSLKN